MYKRIFPGGGLHPQPLALAPLDSKSAANVRLFSDIQAFYAKKHSILTKNVPTNTYIFNVYLRFTILTAKKIILLPSLFAINTSTMLYTLLFLAQQ